MVGQSRDANWSVRLSGRLLNFSSRVGRVLTNKSDENELGWRLALLIERLWRALFGHEAYRMEVKSAGAEMTTVRAMGKRVRMRPYMAIGFFNRRLLELGL